MTNIMLEGGGALPSPNMNTFIIMVRGGEDTFVLKTIYY